MLNSASNWSLQALAVALGGVVSGDQVQAPGPGHRSIYDRSLSVKLDAGAPDGFVVYSHAGDDINTCRDFVRSSLGLEPFKPNGHKRASSPSASPPRSPPTDEVQGLGKFAEGVRSWKRTIAMATPERRPDVFVNCCREGGSWVAAHGVARADIADVLTALASTFDLYDVLDGDDGIEAIIADAFETAETVARLERANGEDIERGSAFDINQKPATPLGEWDGGDDLGPIPPRGWLLGNVFCRRFVSSLIADGGVGKTAVRLAQYLSAATNRGLTGEHVFMRCRVLVVSLEDDTDELRRRLEAAMLHFGIKRRDVKGWLFLVAPGAAGGKIMTTDRHGQPVIGGLTAKLTKTIINRRIDIVALDPFVKSHGVEENHNSLIDAVVQVLSGLAVEHDIAVDVPHHTSKGPADPGNASKGRGASSMKDAVRLVYTLSPMSLEEAQALALPRLTGAAWSGWTAPRSISRHR
jgi:hypothetical protein